MIGYLSGTVLDVDAGVITLVVSQGSVGYTVRVPENSKASAILPGSKIELFIYTHVREDALDLYGFSTQEEKKLFLALTSVNGIGPKLGMTLISHLSVGAIIEAIVTANKELLTAVPGVGKKTVERMILELQEKFKKADFKPIAAPASGSNLAIKSEVAAILSSLGYRSQETDRVISQVLSENPNTENIESIIQAALKLMSIKSKRTEITA